MGYVWLFKLDKRESRANNSLDIEIIGMSFNMYFSSITIFLLNHNTK